MNTTTMKLAADLYDAGLGIFSPLPILWASDKAADVIGVEAAKRELKKINRTREKNGLPVACFEFGHRMF
jgi:tRNA/tmRNA/rRNA uracil-C5-methylase (TrmA/RlmC/RlmD family)